MPLSDNTIIVACAGAGKTTRLVDAALSRRSDRILIVTYTNNNVREIIKKFEEKNAGVPAHVEVTTWYGFLLRECARPYQRVMHPERIESLFFVNRQSARGVPESDTGRHYFCSGGLVYSDKIAKFVSRCDGLSSGAIAKRLSQVYTDIFIDEFQDLAGWDFDVIETLLKSDVSVTLVGDPRQHIYSTNPAQKNRQYLGIKVIDLIEEWRGNGLCSVEYLNKTHRCNQPICDFVNGLWPGMPAMTPVRECVTDHDGMFLVSENAVRDYVQSFGPRVLRHDKKAKTYGQDGLNFGLSKGLEFDRVLIVPTAPIKAYLRTGELRHIERSRDRLHVAVTRASTSVAFVYAESSAVIRNRWTSGGT